MLERAWFRDWNELKARYSANIPPMPDPVRQQSEYLEWVRKHAWSEQPPEWKQLMDDMQNLPSLKYRKDRDEEVWSWIYLLLISHKQRVSPHDLGTCKLGANPANENAQPSKIGRASCRERV